MASSKHEKDWVLTAGQDYPPHGHLCLGQILEDPFQPASGLIPSDKISKVIKSTTTRRKSVKMELNDSLDLWATTPQASMKVETGYESQRSSTALWHFDILETNTFQPSLDYVEKALHSGDVPRKTQWWKIRRALYMVTGLRTARGATLVTSESEKSDFRASTEGDATAKGIAFKAGVGAKRAKAASKAVGAKDMS